MPTEWQYHADGVNTAVSTAHRLDGTLKTVTVQLDTFRVREWEPSGKDDEKDIRGREIPNHAHWNEEEKVFEEHGNGANATIRFSIQSGVATFESIDPEDGDRVEPRHFALLPAAERVVGQISGVAEVPDAIGPFRTKYRGASEVYIERLDG